MKVRNTLAILAFALAITFATPAFAHRVPPHHLTAKQAARKAVVLRSAAPLHLSRAELSALVTLCWRESSWRPTARNHSCKGLFQLKTQSRKWADPRWNTRRANRYVHKRYGSWRAALAHSFRKSWY